MPDTSEVQTAQTDKRLNEGDVVCNPTALSGRKGRVFCGDCGGLKLRSDNDCDWAIYAPLKHQAFLAVGALE